MSRSYIKKIDKPVFTKEEILEKVNKSATPDEKEIFKKIFANITMKDDCYLYNIRPGTGLSYTIIHNGISINVKKFLWEFENPTDKINEKTCTISQICTSRICVNPHHYKKLSKNEKEISTDLKKILIEESIVVGDCLVWNFYMDPREGYAKIVINKKSYKVHELSYMLSHNISELVKNDKGAIPVIVRNCDTHLCIKPEHLSLVYMNEEDEKNHHVLDRMKLCITKNDKGCHIWNGYVDKSRGSSHCFLNFMDKRYNVHIFLWNYYNPDDIFDPRYEKMERTCGDSFCTNVSHIYKILKMLSLDDRDRVIKKIMSRITIDPNTTCWIWNKTSGNGEVSEDKIYGAMRANGKMVLAHRLSFLAHSDLKEIPLVNENGEQLVVRHSASCSSTFCVNPAHLKLGTQSQNCYQDRIEAGTINRGEKNHSTRITEEKARAIKDSKKPKGHPEYKTQKERAALFETTLHTVCSIDIGNSWSYLDGSDNSELRKKRREQKKRATERVWTKEMYEEAVKIILERCVESKTIKAPFVDTPCLLYKGGLDTKGYLDGNGYGKISLYGKEEFVHIIMCAYSEGRERPDDLETLHRCGVRNCARASHLWFSTHSNNMIDAILHGSNVAKLTPIQIKEIRLNKDNLSRLELAKKYKVDARNISSIRKGKNWKHVKDDEEIPIDEIIFDDNGQVSIVVTDDITKDIEATDNIADVSKLDEVVITKQPTPVQPPKITIIKIPKRPSQNS